MKTLIIYHSMCHGNTEKVAREMAKAINADLATLGEAKPGQLEDYDLIGFGSGIFFQKHHKALLGFADSLEHMNKKAFVFSTSGMGSKSIHNALRKKLSEKEYIIIGEFACRALDTWGPFKIFGGINKGRPDENDLREARKFAEGLKGKCK